jgi:hypothetical protein
MKAINGRLDMSKTYKLVSVEYGELSELNISQCENCGNVISNVAIVMDNDGISYGIGVDCAQTITNMPFSEQQQIKNVINRKRKFLSNLKKAQSITFKNDMFWFYDFITAEWNHRWVGRGDWQLYKKIAESLNIPITFES